MPLHITDKFYGCVKTRRRWLPHGDDVRRGNKTQVHQSEMVAKNRALAVVQHLDVSRDLVVLLHLINDIHHDASHVWNDHGRRCRWERRKTEVCRSQLQRPFPYWNNLQSTHKCTSTCMQTLFLFAFSALMLLVGRQKRHSACKNWVVRYWRGYLSGARRKWFAYGLADVTATQSSLAPVKSRMVYLSGAGLPRLSRKRLLNGRSSSDCPDDNFWMKWSLT